jgi:hypothetical protein
MGERVGLEDSITPGRKEKVQADREPVRDAPVIRDSPIKRSLSVIVESQSAISAA